MKQQVFTQNLLKYIPYHVIKHSVAIGDKPRILPELQALETVVMFSDISGFTSISEACSKMGARGAEELIFCINRYMEGLVKCIGKYGGDIIKFVGDAMIVVWPRGEDESLQTIIRRAIQSGLEIQAELNNKRIMQNVSRLSVKIGIGAGKCGLLHVGGIFKRAEFFAVGDALSQALESEHCCTHGGQVIVSKEGWNLARDFFEGTQVAHHENFEITDVRGVGLRATADALFMRNQFDAERIERIQSALRCYVPAAILPYLEMNIESYGLETRRLSIMFVSLGIDLSETGTQEGLERIQNVVITVQKCVYAMEGSLNKLLMDDKGSTLICIWGIPPLAHDDDAVRAIMCATQMRKKLGVPGLNCQCNVGISTGVVFAGVVGTSGSRREYSVIGDVVNLSARIMAYPKYNKEPMGKIYVDQKTKEDACQKIRFRYKTHASFKGKAFRLPIFEPIDPEEEFAKIEHVKLERLLVTHSNPFFIDRESVMQYSEFAMFGRNKLKERAINDFAEMVRKLDTSNIVIIEGTPGSGKSLLARELAREILRGDEKRKFRRWAEPRRIELYASYLNPVSEKLFLNNWRLILHAMSKTIAIQQRIDRGGMLEQMIAKSQAKLEDKLFIIEDIFAVTLPKGYDPESQYAPEDDPISFVKKEEYPDYVTNEIIKFVVEFFQNQLGEEESDSESSSDESRPPSLPPVVLFLDDASKMDKESWELVYELQDNLKKIFIYLIIRTDSDGELQLASKELQTYFTFLEEGQIFTERYTVHGIPYPFFLDIIRKYGEVYSSQIKEEIKLMAQDADPAVALNKIEELTDLLAVKYPVSGIEKVAIETIVSKTEGNPLLTFQFIFSLIKAHYFENIGGVLAPNEQFMRAKDLNDWAFVEVPDLAFRTNAMHIDRTLKATTVKDIVSLKTASILGQIYTLRHLKYCSPLRSEGMTDLLKRMKLLETMNIIEIIDDNGVSDMTCRFLIPFYRETLYQKLLFREHKKGLHTAAAEYILNNVIKIDDNLDAETQRMITHMLVSEDVKTVDELSVKNKRMITIKIISNLLLKDTKTIKAGHLLKQGDSLSRNTEDRFVVVTRDQLDYFHSEHEFHDHDPLATICLKNIGSVIPYERKALSGHYEFVVSSSAWIKKDQNKGHREFYFVAKSEEERDEWITTIELLKTIAVHKSFQSSFGAKLAIPLRYDDPVVNLFDKKLALSTALPARPSTEGHISKLDRKKTIKSGQWINSPSPSSHREEINLKEKIKIMFNYMLVHLTGHLMEHSFRNKKECRKELSETPSILEHSNFLSLMEDRYPMLQDMVKFGTVNTDGRGSILFVPETPRATPAFRNSVNEKAGKPADPKDLTYLLRPALEEHKMPMARIREERLEDEDVQAQAQVRKPETDHSTLSEEGKEGDNGESEKSSSEDVEGVVDESVVESDIDEVSDKCSAHPSKSSLRPPIKREMLLFPPGGREGVIRGRASVMVSVAGAEDNSHKDVPLNAGSKRKSTDASRGKGAARKSLDERKIRYSLASSGQVTQRSKCREKREHSRKRAKQCRLDEGLEAAISSTLCEQVFRSECNDVSTVQRIVVRQKTRDVSIVQLLNRGHSRPAPKPRPDLHLLEEEKRGEEARKQEDAHVEKNLILAEVQKFVLDTFFSRGARENKQGERRSKEAQELQKKFGTTARVGSHKPSIDSTKFRSTLKEPILMFSPKNPTPVKTQRKKAEEKEDSSDTLSLSQHFSMEEIGAIEYGSLLPMDSLGPVAIGTDKDNNVEGIEGGVNEEEEEEDYYQEKTKETAEVTQRRYGFVTKSVTSMGGDIFDLSENTLVIVEKVNEEDGIVTCTSKDRIGLFPLDSIKIGSPVKDKRGADSTSEHAPSAFPLSKHLHLIDDS